MRELDYNEVEDKLVRFIKREFKEAGFEKAVIGVSGGLDSAVSATLAVRALGAENVHAVLLPYGNIEKSITDDVLDAKRICKHLGIKHSVTPITEAVDGFETIMKKSLSKKGENYDMRLGNIMARVRMIALFDYSSANKALVLGTENKTESASDTEFNNNGRCIGDGGFGYFTMFGDSASCIEPLSELYKTEVFKLANHLNLPEFLQEKKPSARLFDGHSDEEEMGITYAMADPILYFINEENWDIEHFKTMGFNVKDVKIVFALKKKNCFKSDIPILCPKRTLSSCIIEGV